MQSAPIPTLIVLSESDENISKWVRTLPNETISIPNMTKLNIRLPKRTWLDFSEPHLLNTLKELLKNFSNIGKKIPHLDVVEWLQSPSPRAF